MLNYYIRQKYYTNEKKNTPDKNSSLLLANIYLLKNRLIEEKNNTMAIVPASGFAFRLSSALLKLLSIL